MSAPVTTVTTVATPATAPFTPEEDLFSIAHQLFDQYRIAIFVLTGTVMTAWLYNKLWVNRKFYPSMQLMQGKTVVITGGNTGIGYETAKDLLRRGARVIIACRNMDKGRQAIRQLRWETECEEKSIRLMECDLCSFESIHNFAKLYDNEEERLDVLICNAGLAWPQYVVTKDGFNSIIQANYLGHFLLTNLLLDKLKKSRPSRIINVSSGAHKRVQSIDWFDVFTQFKNFHLLGVYASSKAFQILSTYKLKQDLLAEGVDVFSVNPGWVRTSIQSPMREAIGIYRFIIIYPMLRLLKATFAKTPKAGARTIIYCAVEPSLEHSSDLYFKNCAPARTSSFCADNKTADHLWELSAKAVGLK
ncbi:unnamed protein product [Rotaria sordida]|uniref:Retinol dehydrogenase 12 n=1 Tax=Rotaria sordida TaxID=392033 RepID=A0A816EBB0_9BILA|nr:unnamed protein product [Rotaria sordida]CAF1645480.1 unnamed protein product [Rotaria sordida]